MDRTTLGRNILPLERDGLIRIETAPSDRRAKELQLTKAGEKLNLSQPAVSAQIKRIQSLLGGELFKKTPNGTSPTGATKLVLPKL